MSALSLQDFRTHGLAPWLIAGTLCCAALAGHYAKPDITHVTQAPVLETSVPRVVGQWQALADPLSQVSVSRDEGPDINQPYDQTVLRTYRSADGSMMSLALAWGQKQRQEVKIHRPELCYPAQGFSVKKLWSHQFDLKTLTTGEPIMGKRMIAQLSGGNLELVSYWIRIGDSYSDSAITTRWHILKEGLAGRYSDGILVRVSQRVNAKVDDNHDHVFERQEVFLKQLIEKLDTDTKALMMR